MEQIEEDTMVDVSFFFFFFLRAAYFYEVSPEILTAWQGSMKEDPGYKLENR